MPCTPSDGRTGRRFPRSTSSAGHHDGPRGRNLLDTGAPYYEVYRCADGKYISIAPIEPKFRSVLVDKLRAAGADVENLPEFDDRERWPELRPRFERIFGQRTREDWCKALEGTDSCFAPVLSPREAPKHPHHVRRGSFIEVAGIPQPAPAPRFSVTPTETPAAPGTGGDTSEWVRGWGVEEAELIAALRDGS